MISAVAEVSTWERGTAGWIEKKHQSDEGYFIKSVRKGRRYERENIQDRIKAKEECGKTSTGAQIIPDFLFGPVQHTLSLCLTVVLFPCLSLCREMSNEVLNDYCTMLLLVARVTT